MAEDGLEVPPAPEGYGPRRLMRYRRAYLARLRGEAPDPETQGVPIVPVIAPDAGALRIQQRFAALADRGSIGTLTAEQEFEEFLAGDGSALPFREQGRLEDVSRQILGEGGLSAAQPVITVNPAHLSGFSSTDIQTTTYDENLMGPMTMSVPIVFAERKDDAGGAAPAPGATADSSPDGTEAATDRSRPSEATGAREDAEHDAAPEGQAPRSVPAESADPDLPADPGPAGTGAAREVAPETVSAQPVSAMDAHGLDLTGLDQKTPGNGGKIALITILVLVVAAAIVLGIVFFMP